MLRTGTARAAGLILTLVLAALLPAAAQQTDAATKMTGAFQALLASVEQQSWTAAREQAQAVLAAYAQIDQSQVKPDHLYMVGVAHYWLMGLTMEAAVQGGDLAPERLEFARQMADLVLRGGAPERIKVIGCGERVTLEDHLLPGMITIVDFYSEFCPPCMAIAPRLEDLIKARSDLALVKVDINRPGHQGIDWQSPVATQFGLRGIPHFRIYDAEGKLMAEGQQASAMIRSWLDQL